MACFAPCRMAGCLLDSDDIPSPLLTASSERAVARPTLSPRFGVAQMSVCNASGALVMQRCEGVAPYWIPRYVFCLHLRKMGGSAFRVRLKIPEMSFAWLWEGVAGNT